MDRNADSLLLGLRWRLAGTLNYSNIASNNYCEDSIVIGPDESLIVPYAMVRKRRSTSVDNLAVTGS